MFVLIQRCCQTKPVYSKDEFYLNYSDSQYTSCHSAKSMLMLKKEFQTTEYWNKIHKSLLRTRLAKKIQWPDSVALINKKYWGISEGAVSVRGHSSYCLDRTTGSENCRIKNGNQHQPPICFLSWKTECSAKQAQSESVLPVWARGEPTADMIKVVWIISAQTLALPSQGHQSAPGRERTDNILPAI